MRLYLYLQPHLVFTNIINYKKMKKSIFTIIFIVLINTIYAQEWKKYPYSPDKSKISFPIDEGYHSAEPTEWWYTFAHLKGQTTGTDYTMMLTFISRDTLIFNGLRIFNLSNENTGEFYHDGKPFTYTFNSKEHQEINALVLDHNESWITKKDSLGNLIPFNYNLNAKSPFGAINLDMDVVKRPLILADSGFLYQGISNYTYYYSFTEMNVTGTLSLGDITEEVVGTGWFDKQYGNFHPEVGEKYEWLSIKLSNGMDINSWNIFTVDNELPKDPRYRMFNCYINDSTFLNTSDFNYERLGFYYSPDSSRIYGEKFRVTQEELDLDIIVTVQNPNCEPLFPFPFYEGPTYITGTVKGVAVTGKGFAELLHFYEKPVIKLIAPNENWNVNIPLLWSVINPDAGRPLTFDVILTKENSEEYLVRNITDTSYLVNSEIIKNTDNFKFTIIARSIDSILTGIVETDNIVSNEIVDNNRFEFEVFPTLFKNTITLKSDIGFNKGMNISVISQDGKIISKKLIESNTNEIILQTDEFNNGMYLLTLKTGNSIFVKRIIRTN